MLPQPFPHRAKKMLPSQIMPPGHFLGYYPPHSTPPGRTARAADMHITAPQAARTQFGTFECPELTHGTLLMIAKEVQKEGVAPSS